MEKLSRLIASAVGVLVLFGGVHPARAQGTSQQIGRVALVGSGSIAGTVQDEQRAAIAGAMVSAVGATTAFAISDRTGHFEFPTLAPGPYLVRAHLSGFVASRGQIIEVRPSARASSSIALRHAAGTATAPVPVLAAGLIPEPPKPEPPAEQPESVGTAGTQPTIEDDHGEVAWRLRHARRGVLKNATLPDELLAGDAPTQTAGGFGQPGWFGRAAETSAHVANLFSGAPFSGQFNLVTTGSFDSPLQLFSSDSLARSIAYLSLGAPVGGYADWRVRGALVQGDISSWVVAAAYTTRAPARHQYDVGLSYSTQRYDAGSPTILRDGTSGSRSAGAMYGFDTFTVAPAVSVAYGARVARYDYLDKGALVSPRVALKLSPTEHFRIDAIVSHRTVSPGAEEFLPPMDDAVWLPPQRTFSSLASDRRLRSERTNHIDLEIERDVAAGTVSVRTFRQQVADHFVTMFGLDLPGGSNTHLGHYLVANGGDVDAYGWGAALRTPIVSRIRGSVAYSQARTHWSGGARDLAYLVLFAPAAVRVDSERVHDVATTVETRVPETSTRVLVLYRVSSAFATANDRPAFDSRFDVQVRQSLPFLDFTSAKWEMLLGVRNVFHEAATDASVYDELLVIRPPKRFVGGLTLRF